MVQDPECNKNRIVVHSNDTEANLRQYFEKFGNVELIEVSIIKISVDLVYVINFYYLKWE